MDCGKTFDEGEACPSCGFPLFLRGNYKGVNIKLKEKI